jgi:Rrf2 family protein
VQIPAKAEYALRALLELSVLDEPATADSLAHAQELPTKFLSSILNDLRRAGYVTSRRGQGGYLLTRPAGEITVAEVMRTMEGSLVEVHGRPPEKATYRGAALHLREVWLAARASLSSVLETVTLEDIASGRLPVPVARLAAVAEEPAVNSPAGAALSPT